MLANNIRRASAILSRQRKTLNLAKRCLSSKTSASSSSSTPDAKVSKDNSSNNANAAPKYTAPRGLPTRHSRHHKPTVAPADVLDASSQKIIASMPGTLFCKSKSCRHDFLCQILFHLIDDIRRVFLPLDEHSFDFIQSHLVLFFVSPTV
jgi:hypothetical protein